eukprot:3532360-Rhodomonas_salina.1
MELPKEAGVHSVNLGKLYCNKFVALSLEKQWWMHPSWGNSANDVPAETQLLLMRLSHPGDSTANEAYLIILPLLNDTFRSSLSAGANGAL